MNKNSVLMGVLAPVIALSACGSTDGVYKNVKELAAAYEETAAAVDDAYTCKLPDRSDRKRSTGSQGYESAECLPADYVTGTGNHVGIIVAVNSSGEEWMNQYPLTEAMPRDRGVLKDTNFKWQITGPPQHLKEVQEELGGELTVGHRSG